jgi:hypothetical protein
LATGLPAFLGQLGAAFARGLEAPLEPFGFLGGVAQRLLLLLGQAREGLELPVDVGHRGVGGGGRGTRGAGLVAATVQRSGGRGHIHHSHPVSPWFYPDGCPATVRPGRLRP